MYAMISAVIFAALAAAHPEAREASIVPRTALSAMSIKEADQVCDPYQKLVCCNKDKECGEVKLGNINQSDFLYEHCTATVVCCDFDTNIDDTYIWGDVVNNCIYVGNVVA